MAKKYTLNVNKRGSRPRSERLRKLGGTAIVGGGSTVVNVTSSPVAGNADGHTHANKSLLDRISADEESYLYLDQLRETEDGTGYSTCTDKVKAGYADEAGHAKEADKAKEADNADMWDKRQFDDYLDQPVRKTDSVQHKEVITDTLRGAGQFVDGLLGSGYRLWRDANGLIHLTIDKLTVRQTMVVLELLVERIRSVGGQIVVSAANGKIKTVEELEGYYCITFEQDNQFQIHDLVRCQVFANGTTKGYWVEVADVQDNSILVPIDEFAGTPPEVGDECVLMGNSENTARQNLVLISATEDGQPRIDVMNGVSSKSFEGCLRARFGNLDGISDTMFPADKQPHGDGLYSDNAFLRGTFILANRNMDVETMFEITEGKIEAAVTGIRQDFLGENGYLNNAAFADGMDKWTTENETVFFLVGNKWIWANKNVLSKKGNSASVTTDNGRVVVRIRNKYILQKYDNLRVIPEMGVTSDGLKTALPVYLSFFYRCAEPGTLKVAFENVDKTGFVEFDSLNIEEQLQSTDGLYKQYTCSGLWNGTGDFKLSFTGDIYLYMLVLSTDKVEAFTYQYKTLLEQSERLVKISAAVYDKDEALLEETGLITTSKVTGMYAIDGEGNLKSFVGASQEGVKIRASNIVFEGLVTANDYFKILEDGSIQAASGVIGGFRISGTGLTNSNKDGSFTNDAYIVFRNDEHNCFAGIGGNILPTSSGLRGVARFENEDESDQWGFGANYAMLVSARGASDNVAISMLGGHISGLAVRTGAVSTTTTLGRTICSVACINTEEITITLPEMQVYDDGHVVKIKNLNGKKVNIKPGYSYHREWNSTSMTYDEIKKESYIHSDQGSHYTNSSPDDLSSAGDAAEYVFHRDLTNNTQSGCWVQYKHPRDW